MPHPNDDAFDLLTSSERLKLQRELTSHSSYVRNCLGKDDLPKIFLHFAVDWLVLVKSNVAPLDFDDSSATWLARSCVSVLQTCHSIQYIGASSTSNYDTATRFVSYAHRQCHINFRCTQSPAVNFINAKSHFCSSASYMQSLLFDEVTAAADQDSNLQTC